MARFFSYALATLDVYWLFIHVRNDNTFMHAVKKMRQANGTQTRWETGHHSVAHGASVATYMAPERNLIKIYYIKCHIKLYTQQTNMLCYGINDMVSII